MALSPTSSRGGGSSYTAPTSREEWSGNGVVVPDASSAALTWNTTDGPDVVLNNSVPAQPTIATAGVYFVSAIVSFGVVLSNAYYYAGLHLDRTGFNASEYAFSSQAVTVPGTGRVSDVKLGFAWYIPAAGAIAVFAGLENNAAAAGSASLVYAHVQRLS